MFRYETDDSGILYVATVPPDQEYINSKILRNSKILHHRVFVYFYNNSMLIEKNNMRLSVHERTNIARLQSGKQHV